MNRILAFAFVSLLIACKPTSQNKYELLNKDAAFRAEISTRTGGSFVELSEGYTYYQEANKNSQKSTVILVHGFSVPSYIILFLTNSLSASERVDFDFLYLWKDPFPSLPRVHLFW